MRERKRTKDILTEQLAESDDIIRELRTVIKHSRELLKRQIEHREALSRKLEAIVKRGEEER